MYTIRTNQKRIKEQINERNTSFIFLYSEVFWFDNLEL